MTRGEKPGYTPRSSKRTAPHMEAGCESSGAGAGETGARACA
jgi:hypothetical protein